MIIEPRPRPGEKELVRWSRSSHRVLRRDFRLAGLRAAEACVTVARIGRALHELRCVGLGVERAARKAGFAGPEDLADATVALLGVRPSALPADWRGVLGALGDWMREPAPARPRSAAAPDPDGDARPSEGAGTEDRADDEVAALIKRWYDEHREVTRGGALSWGVGEAEADDAVQEAFRSLLVQCRRHPEAASQPRNAGYFWTAGKHQAEHLSRGFLGSEWSEQGLPEERGGDTDASNKRALRELVGALPEPQRAVVRLCGLEGWTAAEVGEIMPFGKTTVERRLREEKRALHRAGDVELQP